MSATVKYPNPPIQEAVCEIHFDLSQTLTKSQIEATRAMWLPEYPEQHLIEEQGVTIQVDVDGVQTEKSSDLGHRLICKSVDGRRLVQVSSKFLAINQLRPYPGWEEGFRATIAAKACSLNLALGGIAFRRIGLRYINRIDVPEVPLNWKTWFNFELPIPALEGSVPGSFQMQFNGSLPEERRFTIQIISLPQTDPDKTSIMLDLDVIWEGPSKQFSVLNDLLDRIHQPHRLAFEDYLSDNTRRLFW